MKMLLIILILLIANLIYSDGMDVPEWDIGDFYQIINRVRVENGMKPMMRFLPFQHVAYNYNLVDAKTETVSPNWYTTKEMKAELLNKFKYDYKRGFHFYGVKDIALFQKTAREILEPIIEAKDDPTNPIYNPDLDAIGLSILKKDMFYYIIIVAGKVEK